MSSQRIISARIEGVDLRIQFTYNHCGDIVIDKNYLEGDRNETDLWELESPDVRRQIEHTASASLARNGRM